MNRNGGVLAVAVGGFRGWKGRGPSAVDSTPPGAAPKYPDPGQQGNDRSESQGDRIWSGAGFFPRGFPNPPTTCLNFSLWRDLSVWRIWGGYLSRWRSGRGGVFLTVVRSSSPPIDKTNCALDYDSPLGFAVLLSSRWGKAGLWVDFRGSSFDGPSRSRGHFGWTTNQSGGAKNRYTGAKSDCGVGQDESYWEEISMTV